jgi:NAD(P)-dependent dehydrogenase (short-subunit alcohol dehydrogenase family)
MAQRVTYPAGMADTDLTGTRTPISNGTSGIGLAMAAVLAEAGATVLLTGRDAARAEGGGRAPSRSQRARPRRA